MVKIKYANTISDSLTYSKYAEPISYRLPTTGEWKKALEIAKFNYVDNLIAPDTSKNGDKFTNVLAYWNKRHEFPFYVFPGQLSEILMEDSIINYSWTDSPDLNKTTETRAYIAPNEGLGFRCVCDVKHK